MTIDEAFGGLEHGSIGFDEFARETMSYWESVAAMLRARWIMPAGVEAADLRQELLLGAWLAWRAYDPTRGVPLRTHATWNALAGAKRWLNGQRNAKRRSCHAQSRVEVRKVDVAPDEFSDSRGVAARVVDADFDATVDLIGRVRAARGYAGVMLREVAHAGGDVRAAAAVMVEHGTLDAFGVRSAREAAELIERAAARVFVN